MIGVAKTTIVTGGKDMLGMVDKEYIRKKHLIEGWSI